ncbi:MAG: hypothetical protein WBE37_23955 [Bryobacteraceae bacterium]
MKFRIYRIAFSFKELTKRFLTPNLPFSERLVEWEKRRQFKIGLNVTH